MDRTAKAMVTGASLTPHSLMGEFDSEEEALEFAEEFMKGGHNGDTD